MLEKDFTEVNQVIKHMEKNDIDKISPNFLKMIENNMDNSYDFIYDENKKVYEQNLSKNARIIISIIYIKYLATEEEKNFYYGKLLEDKKLDEKQFSNENMFKKDVKEKYTNKNTSYDSNIKDNQELSLVEKNEKWYKKVYDKLKNLFKKFLKI